MRRDLGIIAAIAFAFWPLQGRGEFFIPTNLAGQLTYSYGYSQTGGFKGERATTAVNIFMTGYFWEPWFLMASTGVSVGLANSDSNTSAGTTSKTLGGNIDLTLFPDSRFPTSMGISVTDSRQDVQDNLIFSGAEYQIRRFYLRQAYMHPQGLNLNAWYYLNNSSQSNVSRDSVDQFLGVQARKHMTYHDMELNANYTINEPGGIDITSKNLNIFFTHGYLPSAEVGFNSMLNYSNLQNEGNAAPSAQFVYSQASSSFYWRPESRPYYVSGGVRLYQFDLETSTARSIGTYGAASYRFSRSTSASLSLMINANDTDGIQSLDSTQSLSLNYFSDPYLFFGVDYSWNANTSFTNSVSRSDETPNTSPANASTSTSNTQAVSVSLSHRASRRWNLGRASALQLSVSQGGSASESSVDKEPGYSLSNSMGLGWNQAALGGNSLINLSASDSRSFNKEGDSAFQVVSVQLARDQGINRLSSVQGFVAFQASRSTITEKFPISPSAESESEINKSASGSISYQHSRFFGIYNLFYSSQLVFPDLLNRSDANAQATMEWNNTWSYRVGLLSLSLMGRMMESGPGERSYTLLFTAMRSF